jgi:8-oxo-dGTP diphosphatase
MLLQKIADNYLWFLVLILVANLYQKKFAKRSYKKRTATLIIASLAMLMQIFIVIILSRELPQWLVFPALLLTIAAGYPFRKKILLFKTSCPSCGTKLNFTAILNYDDNLCNECYAQQHPEEHKVVEPDPVVEIAPNLARTVEDIDWDEWEPQETAVICYLFSGDQVMLIHKKTGLGKGLVNAPGGRIELSETAKEAAIRETLEETGVQVFNPEHMGILNFQFTDGLSMRGHVFFAKEHTGEPVETDEAIPFWCPVTELPYEKMWEDDRLWLPLALEGKHFTGEFIFDGEKMLSHQVEEDVRSED